MKPIFIILISFITTITTFAGTESFIEGTIITKEGKQYQGHVLKRDIVSNSKALHFRHQNGKVHLYHAKDLKGYQAGKECYISQQLFNSFPKKHVFMKEIHEGDITLYVHYLSKKGFFKKKNQSSKNVYLHGEDYMIHGEDVNYCFYLKQRGDVHLTRLTKNKYKSQLIQNLGHRQVHEFVTDSNFHYAKITHLVSFLNN